jgi:hypothetical protein
LKRISATPVRPSTFRRAVITGTGTFASAASPSLALGNENRS